MLTFAAVELATWRMPNRLDMDLVVREHYSQGGKREGAAETATQRCDDAYQTSLVGRALGRGRIVRIQLLFFLKTKLKVEKVANYFPLTRIKIIRTHSKHGILFLQEAAITATSLEHTISWKSLK